MMAGGIRDLAVHGQEGSACCLRQGNVGGVVGGQVVTQFPDPRQERGMVEPLNGLYSFRFSRIPQGTYKIISGSDSNNDFIICDLGESCGAYLTLSAPRELAINRSYSKIS